MGRWGSTAINRLINVCSVPKHATLIDHQSLIDCQTGDKYKKTKLIYSCFFRGDKLDPEIATQWLIINANPTYTPLFPCIPFFLPLPLCVSFTPFGSGVCCNLHLTLALLAVIVGFVAFVFLPVLAWPFSSCFHYTLCCHRSTLALLIFLPLLFELSFGGEGGGRQGGVALTPRLLSRYLHLRQAQSLNEACKQRENFT